MWAACSLVAKVHNWDLKGWWLGVIDLNMAQCGTDMAFLFFQWKRNNIDHSNILVQSTK